MEAVGLIALCFAEVGSRFSGTGGPYLYGREAFGPVVGFMVGSIFGLLTAVGGGHLRRGVGGRPDAGRGQRRQDGAGLRPPDPEGAGATAGS